MPAKNLVLGCDADGLDWRTALSDNNSAYVEIQRASFEQKPTHFGAAATLSFTEYWMPVRETEESLD